MELIKFSILVKALIVSLLISSTIGQIVVQPGYSRLKPEEKMTDSDVPKDPVVVSDRNDTKNTNTKNTKREEQNYGTVEDRFDSEPKKTLSDETSKTNSVESLPENKETPKENKTQINVKSDVQSDLKLPWSNLKIIQGPSNIRSWLSKQLKKRQQMEEHDSNQQLQISDEAKSFEFVPGYVENPPLFPSYVDRYRNRQSRSNGFSTGSEIWADHPHPAIGMQQMRNHDDYVSDHDEMQFRQPERDNYSQQLRNAMHPSRYPDNENILSSYSNDQEQEHRARMFNRPLDYHYDPQEDFRENQFGQARGFHMDNREHVHYHDHNPHHDSHCSHIFLKDDQFRV